MRTQIRILSPRNTATHLTPYQTEETTLSQSLRKQNIRQANCKVALMCNSAPYHEDACDSGHTAWLNSVVGYSAILKSGKLPRWPIVWDAG